MPSAPGNKSGLSCHRMLQLRDLESQLCVWGPVSQFVVSAAPCRRAHILCVPPFPPVPIEVHEDRIGERGR